MPAPTRRVEIIRCKPPAAQPAHDTVVVEEPLEIRIGKVSVVVTMRTPGHDEELAAGFLLTENVIRSAADIEHIATCNEIEKPEARGNIFVVTLVRTANVDLDKLKRNFYATSSCGICGKASIEQVCTTVAPIQSDLKIPAATLLALPDQMRTHQPVFAQTGGLHAAALFDESGRLLCLREDVSRHNAVDKVIGWAVLDHRLPLDRTILLVSGRTSFEIVQKSQAASIPILAAVSAPSSLAIDLATRGNQTLIGFLRGDSFVTYAGAQRIIN